MAVLINFKICDNAKECAGIAACKTNALFWEEKKDTIAVDNGKCTSCGLCEKACMIHAIRVAKSDKEYDCIKKEFDEDPRKLYDLFVDRYGANAIEPTYLIGPEKFKVEVLESRKLTAVEIFSEDTIECLYSSIRIKDIFYGINIKYRKVKAEKKNPLEELGFSENMTCKDGVCYPVSLAGKPGEPDFLKTINVKKLPAMLFYENGKMVGKIEGYYGKDKQNQLIDKIRKIIQKYYPGKEIGKKIIS